MGMAVIEAVAELHVREGCRVNVTASHPALLAHCRRSPRWRAVQVRKTGSRDGGERSSRAIAARRAGRSFRSSTSGSRRRAQNVARCGRPPGAGRSEEARDPGDPRRGLQPPTAARYVGCAVSTIQNTADRDAAFAEKLRQAAYNTEVGLLKNIRNAAKKEQYWRAAAWALERRFPERYARRGPDVITLDQVTRLLGQFGDIVAEEVPDPLPQAHAEAAGQNWPRQPVAKVPPPEAAPMDSAMKAFRATAARLSGGRSSAPLSRLFCDDWPAGTARPGGGAAAGADWTCWPGAGSTCPPTSAARPRTCTAGWPGNSTRCGDVRGSRS